MSLWIYGAGRHWIIWILPWHSGVTCQEILTWHSGVICQDGDINLFSTLTRICGLLWAGIMVNELPTISIWTNVRTGTVLAHLKGRQQRSIETKDAHPLPNDVLNWTMLETL